MTASPTDVKTTLVKLKVDKVDGRGSLQSDTVGRWVAAPRVQGAGLRPECD